MLKVLKISFLSALAALLTLCSLSMTADDEDKRGPWKEDFTDVHMKNDILQPKKWELRTKFGTSAAKFFIVKDPKGINILHVTADKASGTYLKDLSSYVNLNKTPIVRWRWKVKALPVHADGRHSSKDDQAIALYIGTGRWRQESVAYRWETDTPLNYEGQVTYGGGLVKVKWYCVRNAESGLDKWYDEERNIAEDFKKEYGYIPDAIAMSLVSNSQYTNSLAEADVAWIEFAAEK